MARPTMNRQIAIRPKIVAFKPIDVPLCDVEEIRLTFDEVEALRLADYEGLYQEAAAQRMGVSRQTFGRIIETARKKVADGLVNGKMLVFLQGNAVIRPEEEMIQKIAIPTKDGYLNPHFGQTDTYTIFTVENRTVANESLLSEAALRGCKTGMAAELSRQGVRKILVSHIGEGAKRAMGAFGIEVIPVSEGAITEVIQSYLSSLTD